MKYDKGFSRIADISSIGIPSGPKDNTLEDLTSEAVEIQDSVYNESNEVLEREEPESSEVLEYEETEYYLKLIERIWNGEIFEYFELSDLSELKSEIRKAISILKWSKQEEFIDSHIQNGPVPLDEFEKEFQQKESRINALFVYQLIQKEVELYFQTYGKPENNDYFSPEYFRGEFFQNYAYALSCSCFNRKGYNELQDCYKDLETLFSIGSFDEFGEKLLNEALNDLLELKKRFLRDFSEESNYINLVYTFIAFLEEMKANNWQFNKEDIEKLRDFYKYKGFPKNSNFPTVCQRIDFAIRKHRNPSAITGGLLSTKDIAQIVIAQNIIRSAYGAGGRILNSDIQKLKETSSYLKDVIKYKAGLLTLEENDILKQIICELEVIVDKELVFTMEKDKMQMDILVKEASLISSDLARNFKKSIHHNLKNSNEKHVAPTEIYDPLVWSSKIKEESRKSVEVDEKVRQEEVFFKKVKYIEENPSFDYLFAQTMNFDQKLEEINMAEDEEDMAHFLQILSELKLPSIQRVDDWFENDLERYLLVKIAYKYRKIKKDKGSFTSEIDTYLQDYKNEKRKFKEKIIHLLILRDSVSRVYLEKNKSSISKRLFDVYAETKQFLRQTEIYKVENEASFTEFLINVESLYDQGILLKIGEKVFKTTIHSIDEQTTSTESFIKDAKRLGEQIISFASTKNLKTEYLLSEEQIDKLIKVVDFAYDLQLVFPSFDSLYSKTMVHSAISKLKA